MSTGAVLAIAIIAPDAVFLAAIAAAWNLLRQGGGLQVKTPPVPTPQQVDKAIAARRGADKTADPSESVPEIGSAA
jgi:hypothetical protein